MKNLTKSEFLTAVFNILNMEGGSPVSTAAVGDVLEAMAEVCAVQLKTNSSVIVPGLVRIALVKKAAMPERQGVNPFTKLQVTYKAKPESVAIKMKPVKTLKDAVTK